MAPFTAGYGTVSHLATERGGWLFQELKRKGLCALPKGRGGTKLDKGGRGVKPLTISACFLSDSFKHTTKHGQSQSWEGTMAGTEMSLTPQVSNKEKHISWQILTGPHMEL